METGVSRGRKYTAAITMDDDEDAVRRASGFRDVNGHPHHNSGAVPLSHLRAPHLHLPHHDHAGDHPLDAAIPGEPQGSNPSLVVKSSSAPRKRSSHKKYNPLSSLMNGASRVHPVTGEHEGDERHDDHHAQPVGNPGSGSSIGKKNSLAGFLPLHTVHVQSLTAAAAAPDAKLMAITATQRALFSKTQNNLSELFERPTESSVGRLVHRFIFLCIVVNLCGLMFETCDGINKGSSTPGYTQLPDQQVYDAVDFAFALVFTIELGMRCMARRGDYTVLSDPLTWIDVIALVPTYINMISAQVGWEKFNPVRVNTTAHYVMQLRLLRIVRLVAILRHYDESKILYLSIKASIRPLGITFFFLFTLTMLLATALFYAQPCYNVHTCAFTDIINSAYFIMVTVATVGYGNQVPDLSNWAALLITITAMIMGQLYFAMPLAIIGNNFQNTYETFQWNKKRKLRHQDTTLAAFPSQKLNPKAQRLCEIQYHFISSWRAVHLVVTKITRIGRERQAQTDEVLSSQIKRLELLRTSMSKLEELHSEASKALQHFLPHKRRDRRSLIASHTDGMMQSIYSRAWRAMGKGNTQIPEAPQDSRMMTQTFKGKLWLLLEVPESSRLAGAINKVMVAFALLSIMLFGFESLPELHSSGISTSSCQQVVKEYCDKYAYGGTLDSGCFARFAENGTVNYEMQLDFKCLDDPPSDPSACYGYGFNFGNESGPNCEEAFLSKGVGLICYRQQCTDADTIAAMEGYWIYFEWVFGTTFTLELIVRFYASHHRSKFFGDFYNIIDLLTIVPFIIEVIQYMVYGIPPIYAIVATTPSPLSVIRVLKTMRILKLTRHFRGTKILASTAKESYRQLTIPLYFLFTGCILAGAIFYETERGTECFAGKYCEWQHKNVLTPSLSQGQPLGKRLLIQDRNPTIITDMVHSTWLALVTATTVGYGDMKVRTSFGRLFSIFVMIFSTMYTSMPLSLVGGKFYTLYEKHMEKMIMKRGGSSASWRTKRNIREGSSQLGRETATSEDDSSEPSQYTLTEDDFDKIHTFMGMRRTLQNLARSVENLSHVNEDILHKYESLQDGKNLQAMLRNTENLEANIARKSNAILDAILQFSEVVERLLDAPPTYEAFLGPSPNILALPPHIAMSANQDLGFSLRESPLTTALPR
ncbi:TPA: hypothetical protein N0F65_008840 [Lagenidium giganteum]|uniref:Ion transport domain-containing protein n=1 Tax=Lagenidium giganteum TaxID=4803 RepID=A0AAV2YU33_9STRA|nr:TPA: hypothetical protein N0F65_008840 [Lagenidium giganteum]